MGDKTSPSNLGAVALGDGKNSDSYDARDRAVSQRRRRGAIWREDECLRLR